MKSLEDLERAFNSGLTSWESRIVEKRASVMGHKIIREVKRRTPVDTGNLRRRFFCRIEKRGNDVIIFICNDTDYAVLVNNGHRIVRGGKTVGMRKGRHMLEEGIQVYKDMYLDEDVQGMLADLKGAMK